jgi:two-component system chemotaxis response regulator CheY
MSLDFQSAFRVMIVDDNDIVREVLRTLLKGAGYQVVAEANDGDVGLVMAEKTRPDIVFLDVVMPKLSGLDMLGELKQKLPDCVILMVTSDSDAETVRNALMLGVSGYVLKPFRVGTVLDAVKNALIKEGKLAANNASFPGSGSA